ncbi:asparagine-rich protein [Biomphalaria pfeifferi]|uniref:Asparagine-rich protein n=1 Tax=Biomphalaria pfeifferi TaxID=112525 RepID=A0AAD8BBF2_BIOPF|nr:asparagine-rich protein [Biomphalaria pfeifferi]
MLNNTSRSRSGPAFVTKRQNKDAINFYFKQEKMTSHKRRSLTMKQAKIRLKNKGKKKTKAGDKNSQNLPLLNKLIYIDIKQGKQCELIEEQLKKLGAKVEKFLSCEVNYVISLTGPFKTDKTNAKEDNPQSPSFGNLTSPFNCGPSPTGNNEAKRAVVSRGKALAQIACAKNQASSVVANAEKLGIKIISLEAASKWLEKELKKLDREFNNESKDEDKANTVNPKIIGNKKKKKQLKGPFIKFEAINKLYRPVKSELPCWPKINLLAPPGLCPFGEAKLKVQNHYKTRKCLPVQKLPCLEPFLTEHKGEQKRAPVRVSPVSAVVGVPIVTTGEVRGNLAVHLKKSTQLNKQQGYCDCCEMKYNNLNEHLSSYDHRAFARDKSNYESLDALINSSPSTVQFLQSVLLKHCVQKQDLHENSENCVEIFLPVISPISPLTTEKNPSLETAPTSLINPQELKNETQTSKNNNQIDITESLSLAKTPKKDPQTENCLSAVVIRRPGLSGMFTSPRRRQPTPNKKPWVRERSMIFRDSPMASLQPSIKSSPNFTLAESECLGSTKCFSAPVVNKKQESKKAVNRSLIRVIDFTQVTDLAGNNKYGVNIEPTSDQFKSLSTPVIKSKLIGESPLKKNTRSLKKTVQKSSTNAELERDPNIDICIQDDIIKDFHSLSLSTDEKVITERLDFVNISKSSSDNTKTYPNILINKNKKEKCFNAIEESTNGNSMPEETLNENRNISELEVVLPENSMPYVTDDGKHRVVMTSMSDMSSYSHCNKNFINEPNQLSNDVDKTIDKVSLMYQTALTEHHEQSAQEYCFNLELPTKNNQVCDKALNACHLSSKLFNLSPTKENNVGKLNNELDIKMENVDTLNHVNILSPDVKILNEFLKGSSHDSEVLMDTFCDTEELDGVKNGNNLSQLSLNMEYVNQDEDKNCISNDHNGRDVNNSHTSAPNIADRVKTRQRIHQSLEKYTEEVDLSTVNSIYNDKKEKGKKKKNKSKQNLNNIKEYKFSNTLINSEELIIQNQLNVPNIADLALPAVPNIAERVKKRRSCTLFNHEGQYADSDQSNIGIILSPQQLQMHSNFSHFANHKMTSSCSEKSYRRKLNFSANRSTVDSKEEIKMPKENTKVNEFSNGSPAVVIRRHNPFKHRLHTNKDWSKNEEVGSQSSLDTEKSYKNFKEGCDISLLTQKSKDVTVKCLDLVTHSLDTHFKEIKKNMVNQHMEMESSKKKGIQINSTGSPRILLKIKRHSKNTFSSTLEEVDVSSSIHSEYNEAGCSHKSETPKVLQKTTIKDSDNDSVDLLNFTPSPSKKQKSRSRHCQDSINKSMLQEKLTKVGKRRRLDFEHLSNTGTPQERSKSPLFSSPVLSNRFKESLEKKSENPTGSHSPVFKQKHSGQNNPNAINWAVDLRVVLEDINRFKVPENQLDEDSQMEDFSSDATYIYDSDVFWLDKKKQVQSELCLRNSQVTSQEDDVTTSNEYKDLVTFVPKHVSQEKSEDSSWGDICESYIQNTFGKTDHCKVGRTDKEAIVLISPVKYNSSFNKHTSTNSPSVLKFKGEKRKLYDMAFSKESCTKKIKTS